VLVSGKGTRFILANTEQLHNKIHEMSERIRILEDALGSLHHTHEVYVRRSSNLGYNPSLQGYSDEEEEDVTAHPLLQPELLGIKSSMGLYTGGGANPQAPPKQNGSQDEGQALPPGNYHMDVETHRSTSEETSEGGGLVRFTASPEFQPLNADFGTLLAERISPPFFAWAFLDRLRCAGLPAQQCISLAENRDSTASQRVGTQASIQRLHSQPATPEQRG
jgi:hypothetical protein